MFLPFFSKKTDKTLEISSKSPHRQETLEALWRLVQIILVNLEFKDVVEKVVNSMLSELGYLKLGYRIIVLGLVNEQKGVVERIAISQTTEAIKALELSPVPFKSISIPLNDYENFCIKAMISKSIHKTRDWYDILRPVYTPDQAKAIQQAIGIKSSMIYPLVFRGKPSGFLIFSMVKDFTEVSEEENEILTGFTDLVSLAVQNALLFTSLEQTTAQLQIVNRKLQELDKLKDEFVSVASHELRTPMTAIRSYAWMALNRADVPLSKTLQKYVVRILMSTERLINLVNDLLNVSRIESGKIEINPESVDILLLVKDIIDEVYFSKFEEKHIEFVVLEKPTPKIFADPGKLRQVLLNLVGNSMKFTPNGGKITFDFFSDGQVVEISVTDTGVGISKDNLAKLFHKFSRLDTSYVAAATSGGTGLGLYISKSLVELMHGKISVASEGEGRGTTFKVTLPVASPDVLKEAEKYRIKPVGEAKALEPMAI